MASNDKIVFAEKDVRTPKGIARYAYIDRPDTQFTPSKYKIDVCVDPKDPEVKAFIKTVKDFENKQRAAAGLPAAKYPSICTKRGQLNKTDDGLIIIHADRKGDKEPPALVDAKKNPLTGGVWGGDVVRVAGGLGFWNTGTGAGTKLYLKGVQILEKAEREGGDYDGASAFDVEEGYSEDDMFGDDETLEEEETELTEEEAEEEVDLLT